jgi:hypothetical protein
MNITIGIAAMLLGGWVLNSPSDDQSNVTSPASSASSAAGSVLPRGMQRDDSSKRSGDRRLRKGDQEGTGSQERQPLAPGSDIRPAGQGPLRWLLPTPPTDPGRARMGSQYILPTPPTGVGRDAEYEGPSAYRNPTGSPMARSLPEVPTSRQAYSPRNIYSPSYYEFSDRMRSYSVGSAYSDFRQPGAPEKPFSGARPFASGVSPYMGIFRNDTAGGTIDNYTSMVRPQLDQRSMNQQFNLDIYGLERNARLQQAAMRQMNRNVNPRAAEGVGTPQFYGNFGNYYPGLGPPETAPTRPGYGQ